MKIAVIGDEDTIMGFKLAGITDSAVFSESGIKESLERFEDHDLIIMTEDVATYLRDNRIKTKVVAVEVPDKTGSKGFALEQISKLFESAIGVKLKTGE